MSVLKIFNKLIKGFSDISSCSDRRLLNLIQQDDQKAFEVIFERYWAQLYDFVFLRVQSIDLTREIVQEIFIAVWANRKFLPANNLQSYLYEEAGARTLYFLPEPFNIPLKQGVRRKKYVDRVQSVYDTFRRDLKNL